MTNQFHHIFKALSKLSAFVILFAMLFIRSTCVYVFATTQFQIPIVIEFVIVPFFFMLSILVFILFWSKMYQFFSVINWTLNLYLVQLFILYSLIIEQTARF